MSNFIVWYPDDKAGNDVGAMKLKLRGAVNDLWSEAGYQSSFIL